MQKPRLFLLRCRDEASEMFAFGYDEYLLHAFPKVRAVLADGLLTKAAHIIILCVLQTNSSSYT